MLAEAPLVTEQPRLEEFVELDTWLPSSGPSDAVDVELDACSRQSDAVDAEFDTCLPSGGPDNAVDSSTSTVDMSRWLAGLESKLDEQAELLRDCLGRLGEGGAKGVHQKIDALTRSLEIEDFGAAGIHTKIDALARQLESFGERLNRAPHHPRRAGYRHSPSSVVSGAFATPNMFTRGASPGGDDEMAGTFSRVHGNWRRECTPMSACMSKPSAQWKAKVAAMARAAADAASSDQQADHPSSTDVRADTDSKTSSIRSHFPRNLGFLQYSSRDGWARKSRSRVMWQFFEDATSSRAASLYSSFSKAAIVIGVCLTILDLVAAEGAFESCILIMFEAPFVFELFLRYCICPNRHIFWFDPFNIIDLISIMASAAPRVLWRIGVMGTELTFACRVFAPFLLMLRLLRRFEHVQLLASAFATAVRALPVLMYTMTMIALLHAGAFYVLEPRSVVPTVQDSMWFTVLTMFTVSYGDIVPVTVGGKILTLSLITLAVLYTAIPIGIVGNAFSRVWEDRERLLAMQHLRRRVARAGYTLRELEGLFRRLDVDGDGHLTFQEFRGFLDSVKVKMSEPVALLVFETFDDNGCGAVDFAELLLGIFPQQRFYLAAIGRPSTETMGMGNEPAVMGGVGTISEH